jgi:hypothetical protein
MRRPCLSPTPFAHGNVGREREGGVNADRMESTVVSVSPPRLKAVATVVSLTVERTDARRAGCRAEHDRGALDAGVAGRWHRAARQWLVTCIRGRLEDYG